MRGIHFLFVTLDAFAIFLIYIIVSSSNPLATSFNIIAIFYLSLFVTICATIAILRIWLHPIIRRSVLDKVPIWPTLRQSALIASAGLALLMLSALKSLRILDGLLIIFAVMLFEMFFRVRPPIKTER